MHLYLYLYRHPDSLAGFGKGKKREKGQNRGKGHEGWKKGEWGRREVKKTARGEGTGECIQLLKVIEVSERDNDYSIRVRAANDIESVQVVDSLRKILRSEESLKRDSVKRI